MNHLFQVLCNSPLLKDLIKLNGLLAEFFYVNPYKTYRSHFEDVCYNHIAIILIIM